MSNKKLLKKARTLLKKNWIRRKWIVFPDGNYWKPNFGWESLQHMLDDAKKKRANPECKVCAEGAVYLACAMEGDPDSRRAETLIRELKKQTGGYQVYDYNDGLARSVDDVDALFAKAEAALPDD